MDEASAGADDGPVTRTALLRLDEVRHDGDSFANDQEPYELVVDHAAIELAQMRNAVREDSRVRVREAVLPVWGAA